MAAARFFPATVVERRGCDATPLDPTSAEDRLTLMSYVWADEVALRPPEGGSKSRRTSRSRSRAPTPATGSRRRRRSRPRTLRRSYSTRSSFTSSTRSSRARFETALKDAGRRAAKRAPLARVSLEWPREGGQPELLLTTWPGSTRRLATTDDRGREIHWAAGKRGSRAVGRPRRLEAAARPFKDALARASSRPGTPAKRDWSLFAVSARGGGARRGPARRRYA